MNIKNYLIGLMLLMPALSFAQNNIGIGTQTPHSSALLDVSSTTRGLLAPRMTTAQRNAISSPAKGLLVYDTQENSLFHYNGSAWAAVGGSGGSATPKVAFGISGVHASHLSVPNNSGRRVQYTSSSMYDLTQSYTPLVNTYDPATSSTYLVPITGIYHINVGLNLGNFVTNDALDYDKTSARLDLKLNRGGNVSTLASNIVGEKLIDAHNNVLYLNINRDFSLLAGDRLFVEIYQNNAEQRSFNISSQYSYFTGHLVTPL